MEVTLKSYAVLTISFFNMKFYQLVVPILYILLVTDLIINEYASLCIYIILKKLTFLVYYKTSLNVYFNRIYVTFRK